MATTKKTTTKKAAPKKEKATVMYRGQEFTVLEKDENTYKLTDGTIHFYARAKDVEEN